MMPAPLPASLSLVIPVYQNEPNLERLLSELANLKQRVHQAEAARASEAEKVAASHCVNSVRGRNPFLSP
jgi:hypothetical protein